MTSIIEVKPCMEVKYSIARYFHPWRRNLGRDRGMILCLNQDEFGFFVPPGWGRYVNTIQEERNTAMIMSHETKMDVRGNILTRRDLDIMQDKNSTSKIPRGLRHSRNYLVMKWDEDMILINPKRLSTTGALQYRSSATRLPHNKIRKLALVIGERGMTDWAYKWLDLHFPSMKSLELVIFVDSNALAYIQNVTLDLTSGEASDEAVHPWGGGSSSADLLKTYSPLPPAAGGGPEHPDWENQYLVQREAAVASTYYAGHEWGWIPGGPGGMGVVVTPEHLKMLYTINQREQPPEIGYMIHVVPQETAKLLALIEWLDYL